MAPQPDPGSMPESEGDNDDWPVVLLDALAAYRDLEPGASHVRDPSQFPVLHQPRYEMFCLFKFELQGKELEVYEHLTGQGRKQLTSTGQIAKEVGIPDYQVSRIKASLQKKLKRYLND